MSEGSAGPQNHQDGDDQDEKSEDKNAQGEPESTDTKSNRDTYPPPRITDWPVFYKGAVYYPQRYSPARTRKGPNRGNK